MSYLDMLTDINNAFVDMLREFSDEPLIIPDRDLKRFLRCVYLAPWRKELSRLTRAFGIFFNPYTARVKDLKRELRATVKIHGNKSTAEVLESAMALATVKKQQNTQGTALTVVGKKEVSIDE